MTINVCIANAEKEIIQDNDPRYAISYALLAIAKILNKELEKKL